MAEVLRGSITAPPSAPAKPTWEWTLDQLAAAAREGSVPAMTTLERALRRVEAPSKRKPEPSGPREDFGLRAVP